MVKVSVIVPFYKVEQFIRRCALSLLNQTLKDVEFIFVDDASPDKSRMILEDCIREFPNKNIQILTHEKNKGLPAARNTGLSVAQGEYIFHCDSDDFVESTMLEDLYNTAVVRMADYVWCDWLLSYDKTERYMKQPDLSSSADLLRELLRGGMKYNVWNKLVKRDLYMLNGIHFPEGHSMGEDLTMIKLAACAKNVAYLSKGYYHYVRTNAEAMTQHWTERHLRDIQFNVDSLLTFLNKKGFIQREYGNDIKLFKLNVKFPFLISTDFSSYRRWNEWFPESNEMINKSKGVFSFRTRIIQKMAMRNWYVAIWLYNKVVYGIIYRLIYH